MVACDLMRSRDVLSPGQRLDAVVERAYRAARFVVIWLVVLTVAVTVALVKSWT